MIRLSMLSQGKSSIRMAMTWVISHLSLFCPEGSVSIRLERGVHLPVVKIAGGLEREPLWLTSGAQTRRDVASVGADVDLF